MTEKFQWRCYKSEIYAVLMRYFVPPFMNLNLLFCFVVSAMCLLEFFNETHKIVSA